MRIQIDYIKQSISPQDFYQHEFPDNIFKKHGWNDGGLCPFHDDNQTGSFRINTQSGGFTCFSCGAKGGDIVSYTMQIYGLDFVDALQKLDSDWECSS